jgi:two-component system LytT family response regulator
MSVLRVAIVDDEAPARSVLREYLEREPAVEIVAECVNGFDAVKAVTDLSPDLLLLDVQMPKLDGFEVLELVGGETAVIFTTAYDEYALRAFEVHAVDYLLKPFSHERLRETLDRARRRLSEPRTPAAAKPGELSSTARPSGTWLTRIVIRDGAVVRLERLGKDRREAVLRDGKRLPVSESGHTRLQELL